MEWLRGEPVTGFEDGTPYVLDFWATWCGPCIRSMPHLTEVQKEYQDEGLRVVAVNIDSDGPRGRVSPELRQKVREFVEKNEERMGFGVMLDDNGKTDRAMRVAAGIETIPASFIVDKGGRVAWIGHPGEPAFDIVLGQVIDGTYDVAKVKEARELSDKAISQFRSGKRDEALRTIDRIAELDPHAHSRLIIDKLQILGTEGKPSEAEAYGKKIVDIYADSYSALTRIAAVLTVVDTNEALGLAQKAGERAVELTDGEHAGSLAILGGVHAQQGDFDSAVGLLERAKAVAGDDGQLEAELDRRLLAYRAGELAD